MLSLLDHATSGKVLIRQDGKAGVTKYAAPVYFAIGSSKKYLSNS
ncbi:hypothetical protein JCM19237_3350 [Photobacterium aphoticum]|uniref:Uncharacterized protein n=1 Tax=Photobacterium aphoticum TaxID=754436 RepID=A0A090QX16_9GAMM|nr:hypothetical protein JCM19237_3350 [Photobacterium aphoticum]